MIKTLRSMVSSVQDGIKKIDELYVCDLGLSKKNENEFVKILKQMVEAKCSVTYIDHHDLDKKLLAELKKGGVKLLHSKKSAPVSIFTINTKENLALIRHFLQQLRH